MLSKNKKGFTIIELMAVLLVISIGMIGAMNLLSRVFLYSRLNASKLTAAYLAQEGVEIVRNIRDSNWLQGNSWDWGIDTGDQQADYNDQSLFAFQNNYLKLNGGFYNYDAGNNTKFKRKINIQKTGDEISVTVTVNWQEIQRDYKVEVFERLYNWK